MVSQNQVRDRTVVRLFLQRRYLGIDKKGRVVQTHNNENADSKLCNTVSPCLTYMQGPTYYASTILSIIITHKHPA